MSERGGSESTGATGHPRLPERVRKVLPVDTAKAWRELAAELPRELHLGGGTAVAVHLGHRESRDLDFFFSENVDLAALKAKLEGLGFVTTYSDEGTLRGLYSETKIEIFDASKLKLLTKPILIAGLYVGGLQDLMAMKLKVMGERGEKRDYFDAKAIDEAGEVSVEEGIELWIERYKVDVTGSALRHLYLAMGNLDDVEEDELIPISLDELAAWWAKRQTEVLRNSDRFG